ncbi:L-2,4-diaminobutyrate decarboxylase [[Leptolyngbya] sp. PCC 7376]|uniref:L-2,4-diaminobutyrate decarboxylase n=1 Tax=[Leptolyngbya] sp. PCC 7376 TaxID=111781 RepID=K9Q4J3_9CHRO|nr:aspartate aminotransferase family protein [[Leptolyngbya] sp. PCC 7376]AFY40273.1 L-2,4-diaminobutyrate decarboxylase [[Leptolyngbya] sp. PCC 7376]
MSLLQVAHRFERYFLSAHPVSLEHYRDAIAISQETLIRNLLQKDKSYSGATPNELIEELASPYYFNFEAQEWSQIQGQLAHIVSNSVVVHDPTCIAHLHCPPLIPAIAAELIIGATNQSMDSWDQSPCATVLEQKLTDWLCSTFGYGCNADGTFTSGGTQSNLMGLLLARDNYAKVHLNWQVQKEGLPPEATRFRILCSEVAHFTVRQGAALLGLGENAVVTVPADDNFCMRAADLEARLIELQNQNLLPIAIVGTAGTTDFGSIDPLTEIAQIAQKHDIWFHVDAAYGGALQLSNKHSTKLSGIEQADSITVDFHKLFYQPISCGAFLLKNRANFGLIRLNADYLNPEINEEQGIPDLVTKSIQTTRRFDALKLWLSLQVLGVEAFDEMVNTTIDLAQSAAQLIDGDRHFELANKNPAINAVVFRYFGDRPEAVDLEQINQQIPKQLMLMKKAVIAQTQVNKKTHLKFTLLNPLTQLEHLQSLLAEIKVLGQKLERDYPKQ